MLIPYFENIFKNDVNCLNVTTETKSVASIIGMLQTRICNNIIE